MNIPRLYWAARLNTRQALYKGPVREGADYRGQWPWPEWLSRKSMWEDYLIWFEEQYLPVHKYPMDPLPGSPVAFFDAINRYLYPDYHNAVASTFPVEVQEFHRGRWIKVVVRRKFIRLPSLIEAQAIYDMVKKRLDAAVVNR